MAKLDPLLEQLYYSRVRDPRQPHVYEASEVINDPKHAEVCMHCVTHALSWRHIRGFVRLALFVKRRKRLDKKREQAARG